MISILPEYFVLRFDEIRPEPFLHVQGDEDEHKIEHWIQDTPPSAVLFFDLRGKDYVGYSYAKPTIKKQLLKRNGGQYEERRFFLVARLDGDFLDGVIHALDEDKLMMYVVEDPGEFGRSGILIGAKSEALRETFSVLLKRAPLSTGELATMLGTTPQNAKNRVDRLVELGIAVRHKETSPTGGYEWINRIT